MYVRPASQEVEIMLHYTTLPIWLSIWRSFTLKTELLLANNQKDLMEASGLVRLSWACMWRMPCPLHSLYMCLPFSFFLFKQFNLFLTCSNTFLLSWMHHESQSIMQLRCVWRPLCRNYPTKCPLSVKHCCFQLIWTQFWYCSFWGFFLFLQLSVKYLTWKPSICCCCLFVCDTNTKLKLISLEYIFINI